MSDFSDKPLVAGSLIGLRAFDVDRLGRLVSPSYPTIFTPGENVAECKKREDVFASFSANMLAATLYGDSWSRRHAATYSIPSLSLAGVAESASPATGVKVEKPPTHTAGNLTCTCGWYAYFDGGNDYKEANRLSAVVEGYGTCTLGSRGYRAEKMRLVALIAPGRKSTVLDDHWARVQHNYADVPVYARRSEALDAHPLTPPMLPTPETADDFWTRSAR